MKISTILKKINKIKILSVIFWLIVWQVANMLINQEILLVSPFSTIKRLFELSMETGFWISIVNTWLKIVFGFFLAFIVGISLALISSESKNFSIFIEIPMNIIQAVPVVSFIILCLIFIKSSNLSIFISFLIAIPIVYRNILGGIRNISRELIDMTKVFKVDKFRVIRYMYVSELAENIISSIKISFGLCWKAGVASEVIGMPKNTIGENLYNSKVYLNTPDLFAWTIVIVIISFLFQRCTLKLFNIIIKKLER